MRESVCGILMVLWVLGDTSSFGEQLFGRFEDSILFRLLFGVFVLFSMRWCLSNIVRSCVTFADVAR